MRIPTLVLLITIVLGASSSRADCDCPPPGPLDGGKWEGTVAFAILPRLSVKDLERATAMGVHATAGRQLGSWRVSGELVFASFDDIFEDVGGQLQRYGVSVRYRFDLPGAGGHQQLRPGAYVEAGAGQQRIAWDLGGELVRKDLAFGVGYEMATGTRRIAGFHTGLEVLAAESLGDPMDRTLDLTWMIVMGGLFGR